MWTSIVDINFDLDLFLIRWEKDLSDLDTCRESNDNAAVSILRQDDEVMIPAHFRGPHERTCISSVSILFQGDGVMMPANVWSPHDCIHI